MSKLKRLAGDTVLYGLGSILPRFLNFLLVKLHTDESVFDPEAYGVIGNLFAYTAVINVIFMFGMETAYFRFATRPGADEQKIFNLAQTVVMIISVSCSAIFIVFAYPIADMLDMDGHANFVVWVVLLMFIDALVAIPFARLRLRKKALQFASGKLLNIAILVGLNVYFLKFAFDPSVGVGYVILANLIANAFYILFFARTLLGWRPAIEKEISYSMFTYAYPIMITGLAGMTNEMFSRITLKWWLPDNFYEGQSADYAFGIFAACYKFSVLMNLAIQAFRYAAEPFFFSNASDKNSPALFARVNHYFVIVCCLLLLGVGINLDVLKYFLGGAAYWEGLHIVPVLLLGYLFLGVYYNFSVWFKLTDKTHYGTLITVAGAVITIVANYILIPLTGYTGSSWATLLCYFSMAVMCYVLGQKFMPIPYRVVTDLVYIVVTFAVVTMVNTIVVDSQWMATAFHLGVFTSFVIAIYFFERRELRQAHR